jgi:hypothetical protein
LEVHINPEVIVVSQFIGSEGQGGVEGAKVYVRGTDLLCFDHIKIADPESYGATSPLTRSVLAGLAVEF